MSRTPVQLLSTIAVFAMALATATAGQDDSPGLRGVAGFDAYIGLNICGSTTRTSKCLEVLVEPSCQHNGCPRWGYAHRSSNAPGIAGRLEIHLTLDYLKQLRDRLREDLNDPAGGGSGQWTFGMNLEGLLHHQVQMMLRNYSARFWGAYDPAIHAWPALSRTSVVTRRTVNPALFHAVTFVSGPPGAPTDIAHAMDQADFASWLISVAKMYASVGLGDKGSYYLALAERMFNSFAMPSHKGGVRNDKPGYRCHDGRYCYWFHSQPAAGADHEFPSSPLNQNLHAIRDALSAYHELRAWQEYGTCNCNKSTCSEQFASKPMIDGNRAYACSHPGDGFPEGVLSHDFLDRLLDWGRGGLFNLAYGEGNADVEGRWDRVPPPTLAEFLKHEGGGFFRAHYYYWVNDQPGFSRGPDDITAANNCHYHYHSLAVMAATLDLVARSSYLAPRPELVQVSRSLLYGGDASCSPGDRFDGVPLWEFVRAGMQPGLGFQAPMCEAQSQHKCDKCTRGVAGFQTGTGSYAATRAFFDAAYCGPVRFP